MTTFTAARAAASFPVFTGPGAGVCMVAWGTINISVNPVAGDVYEMCRVPKGAVVLGGMLFAADLDTGGGAETLDMDWGWTANGVDAANPDGFGNLGVWSGDAVLDLRTTVGIMYPMQGVILTAGPKLFSAETKITITAVVTAAGNGLGTVSCYVLYTHSGERA